MRERFNLFPAAPFFLVRRRRDMQNFVIPLKAASQKLRTVLNQTEYQLTVIWRDADQGGWVLDIADAVGNPIVSGIPLVTGADLLAQYGYLGINGSLIAHTDRNSDAAPTFDNLGIASHLYFVTNG